MLQWVLVIATAAAAGVLAIPDYSGLPIGPYCAQRAGAGCCQNRQDRCAHPIVGTLCYCDEFCNRTRAEDCCPDYWSHCRGIAAPIIACLHNNKYVPHRAVVRVNCNTCKCESVGNRTEMMCDTQPCMIEPEIVDAVNSRDGAELRWRASNYSEFWGRTLADGLRLRLGTLQPHRSVRLMEPIRRIYDPNALPTDFNAVEKWRGLVSERVPDQRWCGSSWAVSTAAVASDRFAIMSRGEERVPLSAQHLLSCNDRGQQSCDGGHLDRAWLFARKYGLADETCYPYEAKSSKCKIPRRPGILLADHCPKTANQLPRRKFMYRVAPAYRLGNETDIMYEIQLNGPVQATMKVYQDFFSYKSGVYRHSLLSSEHRTAYHSVRIVGWGEDRTYRPPLKYWRVANSWGSNWGENGYFRIVRGTNECEIESFVLAAWAQPALDENEVLPARG